MNRLIISIGAIIIVVLIVIGIVAYMERVPARTTSPSTVTNGFQPLNRGSVNTSGIPTQQQTQSIPYATAPAPTPQPVYQQTIVNAQPVNYYQPFIQTTQVSQTIQQRTLAEQAQTIHTPPPTSETQQAQPIQAAASAPSTIPNIPNLAPYIPYGGPSSTPSTINTNTGGGGGGSSNITSILIDLGVGVLAYLVAGPLGGILVGSLTGAISSLFGGGGGGGGLGAIFGSGGSGNFGGKITNVTYCTCSISLMLDIADVRGQSISLIFSPGASQLYEDYNVFTAGPEVLGTYVGSGSMCEVYDGESCNSQGNPRGTIKMIGTSAD